MADILVIIPTYNEKENIEQVVSEIFKHACDVNVLIVDDNFSLIKNISKYVTALEASLVMTSASLAVTLS